MSKEKRIEKRTEEFETEARKTVEQVQDTADRLKEKPGADRENIQRRADRFADGVEKVAEDLENQLHGGDARGKIATAPIDAKGNYTTSDGSRNNYIDRLETHAGETEKRMRGDARGKK